MGEVNPLDQWRRNVYALATADFLTIISFTMFLPFLPLYLKEMGVRTSLTAWAGIIFGASFLAGGLMTPVWGALGDRYGHRAMVLRSGMGITIVHVLLGLAANPVQLLLLRLLNGLVGGFLPASQALVAATVPGAQVGRALGLVQMSVAAGGIGGPLLGGVLAEAIGMRETIFAAAVVMALATAIAWGIREEARRPETAVRRPGLAAGVRALLAVPDVRTVLAVVFFAQVGSTAAQPVISLLVEGMVDGPVSSLAGVVFAAAGVATVLATPFWSRLGERLALQQVLVFAMVGAGFATLLQGLTGSPAALGLARFGFGLFQAGASQAGNTLLAAAVGREQRGGAFGLSSSVWMLGAVAGPVMGGLSAGPLGLTGPFWVAGVLYLLTGLWLLRARGGSRPSPTQV